MANLPPPNWNSSPNMYPNMAPLLLHPPSHFHGNPFIPRPPAYHTEPYPPFHHAPSPYGDIPRAQFNGYRRGNHAKHGGRGFHNNNGRNNQQNAKKTCDNYTRGSQVSTEEKTKDFHCEPCERDFQTEEHLNAHLKSHTKCEHKDCSFIASRKMLKLHEIQFHAAGRFRIKLDTPEDIAKWKEQRKRNYPSASNVTNKHKKVEENHESGQVLTNKNYKYKGQRNSRGRDGVLSREISRDQDTTQKHESLMLSGSQESAGSPRIKDEDPLAILLKQSDGNDGKKTVLKTELTSALTSLCASYGSDSSDEEGEIKETKQETPATLPLDENRNIHIPGDEPKQVEPPQAKKQKLENVHHNKNKKVSKPFDKRKRPTLLEMLLAPDIRHERNALLQCIRFINRNRFFGILADKLGS